MDILQSIAVYFFIWWITLFLVLPFGVRTQQEEGSVVPGTPESAPARPRLLRIALINTALATAVFIAVYVIISVQAGHGRYDSVSVMRGRQKSQRARSREPCSCAVPALWWSFAAIWGAARSTL